MCVTWQERGTQERQDATQRVWTASVMPEAREIEGMGGRFWYEAA